MTFVSHALDEIVLRSARSVFSPGDFLGSRHIGGGFVVLAGLLGFGCAHARPPAPETTPRALVRTPQDQTPRVIANPNHDLDANAASKPSS